MGTEKRSTLSISARYLGPIFSLDGELTKHAQNLIFARNGTGKSFLSRAFRYLDRKRQDKDVDDAAHNLVSDESGDGKGSFSFARGANVMGTLQLDKNENSVTVSVPDTIFHVFSEDFVHEELRERAYEIDGEIENQISVDSENIKLIDAQKALETAVADEQAATMALREKHENEKIVKLHEKAGINKQLREYKALNLESLLDRFTEKPAPPERSFAGLLVDLDSLKAIPAEPDYPETVKEIKSGGIDLRALEASLRRMTSPSSVSDHIKKKIDTHHSFYEIGAKIVQGSHRSTCPFCEQGITNPSPKAVIDAYISYFEDEEEKHKSELRIFLSDLKQMEDELKGAETKIVRQKSRYDTLKRFVPSRKDAELDSGEARFKETVAVIAAIKEVIQNKTEALAASYALPSDDLASSIDGIKDVIEANNIRVMELNRAVEKSDDERKALQRIACEVFDREFAVASWAEIEAVRAIAIDVKTKKAALTSLEKSAPSTRARVRVAETFELLLKEFFADKYSFNKETFVLKRGEHEMMRGPHRTLSDGEKTAIAFCYFIACVHRKVTSNGDYRRLFLVFDDPVTSMSYDYVFGIAQTLKSLGISDKGEISVNPGKINGSNCVRPDLLILTHSSYFFNIARANRVVKDEATFSLSAGGAKHKLNHLRSYVAPFEQQLTHIYHVANGNDPDHSTGNAIRSVLEAVGRFCRPDKSKSLEDFISFLAGEENISIKSILINSLCHGTYYDEAPSPDDLKLACREAISVVEKFAVGQVELIKIAAVSKTA